MSAQHQTASRIRKRMAASGPLSIYTPSFIAAGLAMALTAVIVHDGDYYVSRTVLTLVYIAFISLGTAILIWSQRQGGGRVEIQFLVIYMLFCLLNLIAIPPFSTPDSHTQYLRALELSQGNIVSKLGAVASLTQLPNDIIAPPQDIVVELRDVGSMDLTPTGEEGTTSHTMALYSPVCFIPQALAIGVTHALSLPAIVTVYAARVLTMIVCGTILFWSIKTTPIGKTIFALSALLPIFLELYVSLSPDGITISAIYALLAYTLKLRADHSRVSIPLLGLLVVVVSLSKIVYLPLCLVVFLIPCQCFGSRRRMTICVSSLAILALALNLAWLAVAMSQLVEFKPGIDSHAQMAFVLSHPFSFISAIVRTTLDRGSDWFHMIFGDQLNNANACPAAIVVTMLAIVFCYACVRSRMGRGEKLSWSARIILLCAALATILLTFASLYVQWTPLEAGMVEGMQGRYFIPLMPPLILALLPYETDWEPKNTWCVWFSLLAVIFIAPLELAL